MPLTPGSRFGQYEVLSPLGAGGMGEVYRARDTRLGRDVAVKVLPAAFAENPERLARFEREARLLASLSHPNIAGIHGLEIIEGHRHLMLEFVDGENLAARLARGPLPVDEALAVAGQIAAALDAAHEAGIVHRDLKPGNVMLTPSGEVKVLDFGLARGDAQASASGEQGLSASPTITHPASMAGVILGTAAYMSPEQARGKVVDRRTDIWSFGCVLYECLTGRTLFAGETVSDIIAKILEREPDWSTLPARTPNRVRDLLRRCLERDPKKRQRDAGDIRLELEDVLGAGLSSSGLLTAPSGTRPRFRLGFSAPWIVALGSLLVALAAILWPGLQDHPISSPPIRTLIHPVEGMDLDVNQPCAAAISFDGKYLVFTSSDSANEAALWLRPLDNLEPRRLCRIESGLGLPFWSPDSRQIGFFSDGKLRTIGIDGTSPQTVCDAPDGRGGSWNSDGVILFSPTSTGPIHRVSASGGKAEPVLTLDEAAGETSQRFPRFLPDGRHFTFASVPPREGEITTYIGQLDAPERRPLHSATSSTVVIAPDRLIFVRGSNLMAQRCDPKSWKPLGTPAVIGVAPMNLRTMGTNPVTASAEGTLVYPQSQVQLRHLAWFSREDRVVSRVAVPAAGWFSLSLSPDDRLAVAIRAGESQERDLWMVDPVRGTASPMTTGESVLGRITWSPDGREIYYGARRNGPQNLYARRTSGSYEERSVLETDALFKAPEDLSPDGRYLLFNQLDPKTLRDLWYVPATGGEPTRFVAGPGNEEDADFSPDGRWVIYTSDESGRRELYVISFPDGEGRRQLTSEGGAAHKWVRDTWEILYLNPQDRVMRMTARPGPSLEVSDPVEATEFRDRAQGFPVASVTRDGRRLLVMKAEGTPLKPALVLLAHWESLLSP